MEKFIQPRGTGRTYNICKYAIENDCDIISPTNHTVEHCLQIVKAICDNSSQKYILCKSRTNYLMGTALIFRHDKEDLIKINFYSAKDYMICNRAVRCSTPSCIAQKRKIVIDDIDWCMQILFDNNIKACSIESYDPATVALKGVRN